VGEIGLEDLAEESAEHLGSGVGVVGGRIAGHVVADDHQLAHAAEERVDEGCEVGLGFVCGMLL
jgi:hypothetical protein